MYEKPEASYYGMLRANVRYDRRLKPMEKIMYTEITCLSNKYGYCYAMNKYFTELYGVSKETVSRWISNLVKLGYVQRVITYKKLSSEIDKRYLTINPIPIDLDIKGGVDLNINRGDDNNVKGPIDDKVKDNTTSFINTININIGCVYCVLNKYPNRKGKVSSLRYIPKLIKKYKIAKVSRAIDRYVEDVAHQRNEGFESLAYKNGSTFFNAGIYDYLDDNYVKPGEVPAPKKKIVKPRNTTSLNDAMTKPEFKKIDFDFGSLIKK
jgi:hypothetical protein